MLIRFGTGIHPPRAAQRPVAQRRDAYSPDTIPNFTAQGIPRRDVLQAFLAGAAGLGLSSLGLSQTARAQEVLADALQPTVPAISPRSGQLVSLVSNAWQAMQKEGLKADDPRWFVVRPNLYASALVGEQGLNPLRFELLGLATTRSEVPLAAVQDNIAALGILAEAAAIDKPELCQQIADKIRPFTEKTLVNYRENGETKRVWLEDTALKEFTRTHAVNNNDIGTRIRLAAQRALGKTASADTLTALTASLYDMDIPPAQKEACWRSLSTIPVAVPLSEKLLNGVMLEIERANLPLVIAGPQEEKKRLGEKVVFLASRDLSPELANRLLKSLTTYFQRRSTGATIGSDVPSEGDFLALSALAKLAPRLPSAQKNLLQVLNTHPALLLYSSHHYIAASYNPACESGESVSRAIKEMPQDTTTSWLLTMAQGNTAQRAENTPPPKPNVMAREVAMSMMSSRPYPEYADTFRKVLQENQDPLQGLAMIGLANLRESSDIPFLMSKVNDASLDERRRILAAHSVLRIAGASRYPEKLMVQIRRDFPLHDELEPMWRFDNGFADFQPDFNPFQEAYDEGLSGGQPITYPLIAQISQNSEFQQKYLAPMMTSLAQKQVGPGLAAMMLNLLGASQFTPAETLIGQIAEQPRTGFKLSGLTATQQAGGNARVRAAALTALGGVGTTQSNGTTVLLQKVLEQSAFGEYRLPAILGFNIFGQKAQQRLAEIRKQPDNETLKPEQVALETTLKSHAEMLMAHFNAVDVSAFRDEQSRGDKLAVRHLTATAVIRQGHEAMVLARLHEVNQRIAQLEKEDERETQQAPNSDKSVEVSLNLMRHRDNAINLAHSLISRGKHLDDPAVKFYLNRHYAGVDKVHAMGATGKGESMLLFDGALPYPVEIPPELKDVVHPFEDKIVYPPWTVFRPRYFDGSHWLMVLNQVLSFAPDIEKVTARSWGYAQKPDVDMTEPMKEPHVMMYLDAMVNRMRPEGDPRRENADFTNNSWGASTVRLYEPEFREGLNLVAGLHHGLSATGVTSVMSAGNGGLTRLLDEYADERATSPIGDMYDAEAHYQATPGVFFFAPLDAVHDQIALKASVPNQANPTDKRLVFSTPGGMEPIAKVQPWTHTVGISTATGSSFAAPSGMGMMADARQLRKAQGLPLWTPEQEEKALLMASNRKFPSGIHRVDYVRLMVLARTTQVENAGP